jgi:hypothetical protein
MDEPIALASSTEAGTLGVLHLKRLWSSVRLSCRGQPARCRPEIEWTLDNIVLNGLELVLEETTQYLGQTQPTFSEFERWILEKNGGCLDDRCVRRINAVVNRQPYDTDIQNWIREIEESEPVLSPEDMAFWEENGYVIARAVVSPENCRDAETAIWDFLRMDPGDPGTWYGDSLRGTMVQLYHHPALAANRKARRLHKAFAQIWGSADLWTTVDRASLNPPETDHWQFPGPDLHWDTSLDLPIRFGVQGILYLTPTEPNQGAFTCVPGFHKRIADWQRGLPPGADARQEILKTHDSIAVGGAAGDLIIWHQALPHGGRPNRAAYPRIAQFIDMYSARLEHNPVWK